MSGMLSSCKGWAAYKESLKVFGLCLAICVFSCMGRVAVIFYFVMLLSVLKIDLTQPTVQEKVCYSAT